MGRSSLEWLCFFVAVVRRASRPPIEYLQFRAESTCSILLRLRFAPHAVVHPESLFLRSDNKKQKATRSLHRMAFARLSPRPSRASVSRHRVRVEVPV